MDKYNKRWLILMRLGKRLGCHQRADRSFFYKKYQFPVCARCTGVIIGEVVALICLLIFSLQWWISLLLLVPMGIDWGLQYLKILESSNIRRLITGLLGGFGLTCLFIDAITLIVNLVLIIFTS